MAKLSIRNRLIISFFTLIIATMTVLGAYIVWFVNHTNLNSLINSMITEAQITERLIQQFITGPYTEAGLDHKLKQLGSVANLDITIIAPDGDVVASSRAHPRAIGNQFQQPEFQAAVVGKTGHAIRASQIAQEDALFVAVPMHRNDEIIGVVQLSTSLSHVQAAYTHVQTALLAAFVITTLLALIFGMQLAKNHTKPLTAIIEAAQQIGEGQLDRRVHVKTGDEIEVLGHTLNNLAAHLQARINEITTAKQKFELVLDQMDNPVILMDIYGRVTDANLKAAKVLSVDSAIVGQHNMNLLGSSQLDAAIRATLNTGQSRLITIKTNIRNLRRTFQIFLAPLTNADNTISGLLSVFHDITIWQEMHDRQTEFIANASHELKTPLTSIKGFAETLRDNADADPTTVQRFAEIIQQEADRMQRLVYSLLQLAKTDAADYRQHVDFEPVDVNSVATTVIEELVASSQAKGLVVQLISAAEPLLVMATADWLKQALVNLVENSIKYTPPSGHVLVECQRRNDHAVIVVRDSGVGIPAADLPHIFERFYRVNRARDRATGGTGLGLAIVKNIVENLGGKIEVYSYVDAGTTFRITLPLA